MEVGPLDFNTTKLEVGQQRSLKDHSNVASILLHNIPAIQFPVKQNFTIGKKNRKETSIFNIVARA